MKMTKIAEAFQNKKAFIGFLTAGDPSLECTEEFIQAPLLPLQANIVYFNS